MSLRILLLFLFALVTATASAQDETLSAAMEVLDDFHRAASEADAERYFGHFAEDAIFLGTDITERWTVTEFRDYAMPAFNEGRGWTYVPKTRHPYLSTDGKTAWFDEILVNERFGDTRGSGVLVLEGGVWKIAQYHLTVPVPNDLLMDVVGMIEAWK